MSNPTNEQCHCCDEEADYSIKVAIGPNGSDGSERIYLPNQSVRESRDELEEMWFCHDCMRFIEDNFRATISYLKEENGTVWARKNKSL